MTRILISDPIMENGLHILKSVGDVIQLNKNECPDVFHEIKHVDVVLVKYVKVDAELMDNAPRLKVIAKHGVGVNNIDVEYASQLGILVLNAPTGNTTSVIEFTWGLIISLVRNINLARVTISSGHRSTKDLWGMELEGKTLGIIGLGTIGSGIARIGKAFKLNVIAYDPYLQNPPNDLLSVQLVHIDFLLATSNIIVIAAPLTRNTYHLISDREFKLVQPGSYLVNTSRGGIVDELALSRAISIGKIAGAALDVVENEPIKSENPLLDFPNVILTPHLASGTIDAQRKVAEEICTDIVRVMSGDKPIHPVNPFSKAHRLNSFPKG